MNEADISTLRQIRDDEKFINAVIEFTSIIGRDYKLFLKKASDFERAKTEKKFLKSLQELHPESRKIANAIVHGHLDKLELVLKRRVEIYTKKHLNVVARRLLATDCRYLLEVFMIKINVTVGGEAWQVIDIICRNAGLNSVNAFSLLRIMPNLPRANKDPIDLHFVTSISLFASMW
jgi:hypothetical protein